MAVQRGRLARVLGHPLSARPAGATRLSATFWIVALCMLAVDWLSKYAALRWLAPHLPREVIGSVVRLTLSFDRRHSFWLGIPGTPFIPLPGGAPVFYAVKLLILAGMIWVAMRMSRTMAGYMGVLFGAGLGNTVEQIATGAVVNFLDVGVGAHRWPTFNLADAALITTGLCLAVMIQREAVRERGWRRSLLSPDLELPQALRRRDQD